MRCSVCQKEKDITEIILLEKVYCKECSAKTSGSGVYVMLDGDSAPEWKRQLRGRTKTFNPKYAPTFKELKKHGYVP